MENLIEVHGWRLYTTKDDEDVVIIEDCFGHQKAIDKSEFGNLMSVIHSINDY